LGKRLPRIDHKEMNRNRVIGKAAGEPRRSTHPGEGIGELALLCLDFLGGELVTAFTTAIFGRASKGHGEKREEDSESDGKAKNHIR